MAVNAQPARLWVGAGLGGSSNGAQILAEMAVSKGQYNIDLFAFDSLPNLFRETSSRSFMGVLFGVKRESEGQISMLSIGVGQISGYEIKKTRADNCYYLCSGTREVDIGNHLSIITKGSYIRSQSVFGVGLMPYVIFGNKEILGGVALQLLLGKIN